MIKFVRCLIAETLSLLTAFTLVVLVGAQCVASDIKEVKYHQGQLEAEYLPWNKKFAVVGKEDLVTHCSWQIANASRKQ